MHLGLVVRTTDRLGTPDPLAEPSLTRHRLPGVLGRITTVGMAHDRWYAIVTHDGYRSFYWHYELTCVGEILPDRGDMMSRVALAGVVR